MRRILASGSATLRTLGYAVLVTPLLRWLVAHHTVAHGQPWRTRCGHCATMLWPRACLPAARCGDCHRRVGAAPYTLEAVAVVAAGLLALAGLHGWVLAAYTWWSATMLVLAFTDAAVGRLPHRLTATAAAGWLALATPAGAPAAAWWSALVAAASLALFYGAFRLAAPSGLGLGDVALAVPAGLALGWLDWRYVIVALLLTHTTAVVVVGSRRLHGQGAVPVALGTHLVAGSGATALAALAA